ncbi:putative LRR receptor-like serine/threonine-protein kinase [Acorus gramineus]|uniref:non-specific serine/threonine protein kinase n=1 Tax=Acorus gramineus TaxID=55184 RepID=A0AAV9B083_ACOGR|nr:putative LRR receptor-like serine/threonine-protein kinase [Acorus gramineus]
MDPCKDPNAPWSPDSANPRIACDCSVTCHVTHLKVYALDVSGAIPEALFKLTELMDLNLGQNVLNGPLPPEIGTLSKMQYLSLGINNLSGPVPPNLGNLTRLISLSFSSNRFSGTLPRELGKLTSLEQLYIDSSGVSGEIPQELAGLKRLKILWASDNLFTGKLPDFIGSLTNLIDLRIQGTLLEGPIPSSFSALTKLSDLRLGDFTNADSSLSFIENMTSLSTLSLRNSRISGQIPEKLGEFSNLMYLDLSFNKLSGQIPTWFKNLMSLQFLFLGNNNLEGFLPSDIITPKLVALDVSFNPIVGGLPSNYLEAGVSLNFLGTAISAFGLQDWNTYEIYRCLQNGSLCSSKVSSFADSSVSVNCGGTEHTSTSGIDYYDDSENLVGASFYISSQQKWSISDTGFYISNPNGSRYIAMTDSQILGTLESELYKSARVSPSSLRYYAIGLKNGKYAVELHFAEIVMSDSKSSWKGLGRRLFDVYIQGDRVLQDFDIQKEAGGSMTAIVKTFTTNVTNTILEVHFFWAGRGTCCIPLQGTYGPLVSAIHISPDSVDVSPSPNGDKRHIAKFVGLGVGCVAALFIALSVFYLWWKKDAASHMRVHTNSPKKGDQQASV